MASDQVAGSSPKVQNKCLAAFFLHTPRGCEGWTLYRGDWDIGMLMPEKSILLIRASHKCKFTKNTGAIHIIGPLGGRRGGRCEASGVGVGGLGMAVMLTPENIVVLCACACSASKLLIFATSHWKRILNSFSVLHYRLRLAHSWVRMNVNYNIDRSRAKRANEKARGDCLGLFVGSPQQFRTFDDSDDFGGLFLNK